MQKNTNKTTKILYEKVFWVLICFCFVIAMFPTMHEIFHFKYNNSEFLKAILNPYFQWISTSIIASLILPTWIKYAYIGIKEQRKIGSAFLVSFTTLVTYVFSLVMFILKLTQVNINTSFVPDYYYFYITSMFLFFASISDFLETRFSNSVSQNFNPLLEALPKKVFVLGEEGNNRYKQLEELKPNEVIQVPKASLVPCDGLLLSKQTIFNKKIWTGNNNKSNAFEGDVVSAGWINIGNSIRLQVTKEYNKSSIIKLIKAMDNAKNSSGKISTFIDKAAKWVLVLQTLGFLLVAIGWFLYSYFVSHMILFDSFINGFIKGMAVTIVLCPCAFTLATPLLLSIATWKAYNNAIAIRNFRIMDILKTINCIAFDKTGTLTTNNIRIANLEVLNDNQEYINLLYSLESHSNHPIAKAITSYIQSPNIISISDVKEIEGAGIFGKYHGQDVLVASARYIQKKFPKTNFNKFNQKNILCVNKQAVAGFDTEDSLKYNAISTIFDLQKKKYEIYIVTGDAKTSIPESILNTLNQENIFTNISPQGKGDLIKMFQQEKFYNVMYIGDGINDVLAAKYAKLFLPIYSGNEFSLTEGDAILLNDNISNITYLINLLQKTDLFIKIAVIWSITYNIVALLLTIFALITTSFAGILMIGSDLILFLIAISFKFKKI